MTKTMTILGNFLCHTVAVTMTHLLCVSHSGCHLMTHLLLMSHSGCHLMTNLLLMLLQLMLKCCNVNQAGSNDLHMGWAHCQGLEASHLIFCCRTSAGILVSTRCLQSIDLPWPKRVSTDKHSPNQLATNAVVSGCVFQLIFWRAVSWNVLAKPSANT